MAKRDYYEVLGVAKSATQDEIKRAYRKLAKQYHPDVSTEANAEEKFKEVSEAYEVVGDEDKRKNYDQFGFAGQQQGGPGGFGGAQGFGGFEDIFSSFFGGGGRTRRADPNAPRAGQDVEKSMTITFEEAVHGTKKTVKLNVSEECTACGGTGAKSRKDIHTCSTCHGTGTVYVEQRTLFGVSQSQTVCPDCHGSGKTVKNKCEKCSGAGKIRKTKNVEVSVPAGINDGMSIRMSNYGEAGSNGGQAGDLFIVIHVQSSKLFDRRENDIYITCPISFSQAALGTTLEVPTINKEVRLKIPAGTQSGTKFRLRNKGVPDVRNKGNIGDQYVIIRVETPKNLSSDEKKYYEAINKLDEKDDKNPWNKFKQMFNK